MLNAIQTASRLAEEAYDVLQTLKSKIQKLQDTITPLQEEIDILEAALPGLNLHYDALINARENLYDDRAQMMDLIFEIVRQYDEPADNKIKIIKSIREVTGLGLKECKEAVDEWFNTQAS